MGHFLFIRLPQGENVVGFFSSYNYYLSCALGFVPPFYYVVSCSYTTFPRLDVFV